MKHPKNLRLVLVRNFLGSALLASPLLAITPAEFDSLRAKADRGNSIAQYNLGLAHADRSEAIYDPAQAYAWLTIASANGTNGKALAQLTSLLTPEQLAEGQRRVALLTASPVGPATSPVSPVGSPDSAPVAGTEPDVDQKKLSAELAAAWKENELLKAGLTAQLADANKRVTIAEAALASKDKEIAVLQQRLTAATSAPATTVQTPPVGVSAELASLRAERDQLQASATAALSQLKEFRAQNAAAETAALREKLTLATARLETVTAELTAAKAAPPVTAAAEVVSPALPAAPATQSNPETDSRLADLEKAKAESDDKLAASLRSFTLQQTELDRLQKALASIDEERAAVAAKLDAANAELATLRPQAASASAVSADAENLRSQLASANQTLTTQASDLAAANRALADARATIDTATADLVATRDQLRQTQAQSAAFAVENQQLKTRLALAGNLAATPAPSRPGSVPAIAPNLPPPPPPPAAPAPGPRTHTVAPGDSLSKISLQYYGTAARWNEILQANPTVIRNPDSLALGTQLRIP